MKTYFELTNGKSYSQLSEEEKAMIQDRQTELVIAWQDTKDEDSRWKIEEELMASAEGLIKGLASRNAGKSFSVSKEDFEGLISLVFAETLMDFDRTLGKPFQPVFILRVKYAILEMYRKKGYDLHDISKRLELPVNVVSQYDNEIKTIHTQRSEVKSNEFSEDSDTQLLTDSLLDGLFGTDEKKKNIVRMVIGGYKRSEIVEAVREEGKSTDSVAKMVNRTVKQFKQHYISLQQAELV